MPYRWSPREHVALLAHVLRWLAIGVPVGAITGSAVALFLWSLDACTRLRWDHPWLLYLLPAAGLVVGAIYQLLGRSVEGGNNLVVEQIHQPGGGVPARMAPLVLVGTLITHLFGGSAGREGTAVQMGGSLASVVGRVLRLRDGDVSLILSAGVAAGFGAVFGTPLTGAVFALEVLAIGAMSYGAIIPCLIASVVGDWTTRVWGIGHTHYLVALLPHAVVAGISGLSWLLLGKVALSAVAFGLASVVFAELTHGLQHAFKKLVPVPALRPVLGGLSVLALVWLLGTRDYLGLGVVADPHHKDAVCIVSCFSLGGATHWSWLWKIVFTAVTLASGFKGGEVTPLFFVGAALGNTLGVALHAPVDLMAAMGFIAVFAGATNTPLACTIMGIELFASSSPGLIGGGLAVYASTACFVSYLLSGHTGIYLSQRIGTPKLPARGGSVGASLRALRE